uniref:Uncharacterized protein n=1 Tax=Anguilla anguilla TaxID=7936 RepID=A0A0E9WS52_ANGAN
MSGLGYLKPWVSYKPKMTVSMPAVKSGKQFVYVNRFRVMVFLNIWIRLTSQLWKESDMLSLGKDN